MPVFQRYLYVTLDLHALISSLLPAHIHLHAYRVSSITLYWPTNLFFPPHLLKNSILPYFHPSILPSFHLLNIIVVCKLHTMVTAETSMSTYCVEYVKALLSGHFNWSFLMAIIRNVSNNAILTISSFLYIPLLQTYLLTHTTYISHQGMFP